MNLPCVESAEQNKRAIFAVIEDYLHGDALEIGSGTGQHAVFFAELAPEMSWQTTDLETCVPGIEARIQASGLDNLPPPIVLDVLGEWPGREYDFAFTANSFHIMTLEMVAACIAGVGASLKPGGVFAVYGPFNYGGEFTAESNASFDQMLRLRDPASGIKDFEWIAERAREAGLEKIDDVAMPENNRTLLWQKRT